MTSRRLDPSAGARAPRRRLALALLIGVACRPTERPATPETAPAPVEVPAAPRVDPELVKIADAIDPGEVKPLLTAMPRWLARALEGRFPEDASPEEIQEQARADLEAYRRVGEGGVAAEALLRLGRAAYLGERLLLAGRDDAELLAILESAYAALDNPILTSAHGFFRESLGVFVSLAAKEGVLAQESQVGELLAFLEGAFQRVRPLHRRSAALLLRDHPEHPSIPVVLMNLGDAAAADGDHARAVELTRLAIARGDSPTPLTWGRLVTRCADALDLPCAREAREKVAAWAPTDDQEVRARAALLKRYDEAIALATEAVELAEREDLESQLRRGHLLLRLSRGDDAERLYEALRDAHPRDARPYVGLAKVAMQRDYDMFGIEPLIAPGRALDNRDRDFFELSLLARFSHAMAEIMPHISDDDFDVDAYMARLLRPFLEDARGWSQFEPVRGAVLLTLVEGLEKVLKDVFDGMNARTRGDLRRLFADLDRLRVAHPEVADTWKATLVASLFIDDRRRAWTSVSAPFSAAIEADDELQLARLRALRSLVILWEEERAAVDLDVAIALLPERLRGHDEAIEVAAFADAIRAQGGDLGAGRRAAKAFRGLAERRSGDERARALANAVVVLAGLGETEAANEAWASAAPLLGAKTRPFMTLISAVLDPNASSTDALDELTRDGEDASLRLLARAWRAELAHREREPEAAALDRAYRSALVRERQDQLLGHQATGRLGVVASDALTFNFKYSVPTGLILTLEVPGTP